MSGKRGKGRGSPSDLHEQTSGVRTSVSAAVSQLGAQRGSAFPAANE